MTERKPRIAIVSPFIDKRHGTERYIVAWLSRLVDEFEVHVYSQRVEDVDLKSILWHKTPRIPGPHVANYLWWFTANQIQRAKDGWFGKCQYDLVYSAGVNCFDADLVSVHVIFAELLRLRALQPPSEHSSVASWLRRVHRRIYYSMIALLERRAYRNSRAALVPITQKTADELQAIYGRADVLPPIYFGLDLKLLNPEMRCHLRQSARQDLGLQLNQFVLLLIGNDWNNKGLPVILDAMSQLRDLPLRLLVVGNDNLAPYRPLMEKLRLTGSVQFLSERKDVELFYAAADAYVGVSQQDALPLPPAEAMACGLPVIVSATCGIAELIENRKNGLVLLDPLDAESLSVQLRQLYEDAGWRAQLGENAAATVKQYTWERNALQFRNILLSVLAKKTAKHAMVTVEGDYQPRD